MNTWKTVRIGPTCSDTKTTVKAQDVKDKIKFCKYDKYTAKSWSLLTGFNLPNQKGNTPPWYNTQYRALYNKYMAKVKKEKCLKKQKMLEAKQEEEANPWWI